MIGGHTGDVTRTLTDLKDPGQLDLAGRSFAGLRLEGCVLSMSGAAKRSRFTDCQFEDIEADHCHVGHAIFQRCAFGNVKANDTLQFEGRLRNLNFSSLGLPSPFYSAARCTRSSLLLSQFAPE